jgi:hypothetical protein
MPPAPRTSSRRRRPGGGATVCRIPRGSQQTVAALATRGQPTATMGHGRRETPTNQPIKTMPPLSSVTHACIHRAAARKYTARGPRPTGLWRGAASYCVTTGDTRQGRCQGGHAQCLCEATCYQPGGTRCTGRGACYVYRGLHSGKGGGELVPSVRLRPPLRPEEPDVPATKTLVWLARKVQEGHLAAINLRACSCCALPL